MAEEIDFGEVMHEFYAGRQYGVRGPKYEDITWLEEEPKPTVEELTELWYKIRDKVVSKKIAGQRTLPGEYPTTDELVVALWEKYEENRPEAAAALQKRREEIKARYPKS